MFPILYHTHHRIFTEDLDFWLDLADQQDGVILELGCGTGRVLLPLAQEGYTLHGLDNDPGMLDFLRAALGDNLKHRVQLYSGDMTNFKLPQQFALILLACNTYSTLDADQRRGTLGSVRRHLLPGGVFAFSMPNPAAIKHLPRLGEEEIETEFTHPKSGNPVQVISAWERDNNSLQIIWHYDHLLPDGHTERTSATTRHWLVETKTFLHEIEQAQLDIQAIFGDFDHSPYKATSPYLIVQAGKVS